MAPGKQKVPQGGTGRSAAGESSAGPSGPVCPSYSGGGNHRHSSAPASRTRLSRSGSRGSEADVEPTSDGGASAFASAEDLVVGAAAKSYRKRPRTASPSPEGDSRPTSRLRSGSATKRGRGRPPTTGKYVGAAKAQAELKAALKAAEDQQRQLDAEEEILREAAAAEKRDEARTRELEEEADDANLQDRLGVIIQESIEDSLKLVSKVAAKSGNLKGGYVRILNESAKRIRRDVELLAGRNVTEESALLQEACVGMRDENERLCKELKKLRREVTELTKKQGAAEAAAAAAAMARPPPLDAEELTRSILVQVGTMVDAKLATEQRPRPPLAADRRRADPPTLVEFVPAATEGVQKAPAPKAAKLRPAASDPGKGKKQQIKEKKVAEPPQPSTSAAATAPEATTSASPILTEKGWTTVAKKKKGKKTPEAPNKASAGPCNKGQKKKAPKKAQRKRAPRLRVPRSSAVVITLQPGAVERGLSYAAVLTTAMDKVPLADLGITDLRYRPAVTGARIFELPGANSGSKADALALKLREALGAEDVRVSRPTKCAEMRISGLDDSATTEGVVAAVARTGGCMVDEVKAGEVRRSPSGLGSVWVRCPVAAANKVARNRLLVGWVSAQVKLLDARPTRCFRCLLNGHVQYVCTSKEDRRTQCYRCGEVGHLAKSCARDPHCTACAAADRRADHPIGTKPCRAGVPQKGKGKAAALRPTPTPAATGGEVVPMSV